MSTTTLTRKTHQNAEWEIILLDLDPNAPVKALVGTAPKGAPVESFYDPVTDEHITFDSDTATVSDHFTGVTTMYHFASESVSTFLA